MRAGASWTVGAALVVAAWLVTFATPPVDARDAPFVVTATAGVPAAGRDIAVTVHEFRRARSISAVATAGGEWSAEGNWLVVDLDAASVVTTTGVLMNLATLRLDDGRLYEASTRPESLYRHALTAGIPRTGSIVFELPAALEAGTATLRLGLNVDDRLDSVIEIEVPMTSLEVAAEERLVPTGWASP